MDYSLLKTLCAIPSTAGDEGLMQDFVLKYICHNSKNFKSSPRVFSGAGFQDMVIAVFGEPRTAVFAHMDTVGFTVGHNKELMKIGNPKAEAGAKLVGEDSRGKIVCTLEVKRIRKDKKKAKEKKKAEVETRQLYKFDRLIDIGTALTYAPDWKETQHYVHSAYLDNRLGVWNALQQAHTMEDGALVFSTYEEHGGGGAQFAGKFLQDNFGVQQALISDVTLASDSIRLRKGVAVSMRDKGIPRQKYVRHIIELTRKHEVKFQLEVEKAGGSDGNALQDSSYMWDWCFIGPPEENYHCPGEKVAKADAEAMVELYRILLEEL